MVRTFMKGYEIVSNVVFLDIKKNYEMIMYFISFFLTKGRIENICSVE